MSVVRNFCRAVTGGPTAHRSGLRGNCELLLGLTFGLVVVKVTPVGAPVLPVVM